MERADMAVEYFCEGYNCASAVVKAYADLFGIEPETAVRAAEGFGGGIGRMRKTCGAVCGAVFLAGLKYSSGDANDVKQRQRLYGIIRDMAAEFEEKNGSIECGDLLSGVSIKNKTGSKPDERTAEYYSKRPCPGCVLDSVALVEKYLLSDEKDG